MVDKVEKYLVKVESAPFEEAIDEVFEGDFLGGLKSVVSAAINKLLENTSAGEQERCFPTTVFSVLYKYEFSSEGPRNKFRNADGSTGSEKSRSPSRPLRIGQVHWFQK